MFYIIGGLVVLVYIIGIVRAIKGKGKVDIPRKPVDEKNGWQYHPMMQSKK